MQRIAELDDIIRENRLEVEGISERFAAAYTRAVEANTGLDYYKDLNRVSQAADVIKNMKRFAISECSISFPEDDITAAKRVLRDKKVLGQGLWRSLRTMDIWGVMCFI